MITAKLKEPEVAVAFAEEFVNRYLDPAFGARSKSEVDLLVFTCLVKAGVIGPSEPLYDIARALNVTPARVRSLLLNWQLRTTGVGVDLRKELIDSLQKTRFAKDGTLMSFGIESPLLREEVIARLKRRGIFADASFAKELVRLPTEAFTEFLDDLVDADTKAALDKILIKDKQLADRSFRALATGILTKLGEKAAGKAGEAFVGAIADGAAKTVVAPVFTRITGFLTSLLRNDAASAVNALSESDMLDA
jgi:hypothetical protein